jgi:hypothetical protein
VKGASSDRSMKIRSDHLSRSNLPRTKPTRSSLEKYNSWMSLLTSAAHCFRREICWKILLETMSKGFDVTHLPV